MSGVCFLLLMLPLLSAQTYHWGPCPTPKVQPNFNLQQYLGKWYEIEKLPAPFARGKCIEINYSIRRDGTIQLLTSQIYKDKKRHAEGTGVVSDPREPAKLGVSFSYCKYLLSLFYQLFDETLQYSCFTEIKLYEVWWSFEITS
ncbi:apolipoprotein D [Haplochromis burtoni]|uniref:apolipoprotein D n=1 Tax=Haplochromis burtoni TaxID=8153 RepID=UPI001C2D5C55|nr:apolipoprotein D [Haplochromis burtoni]